MHTVFAYGSLQIPEVMLAVTGKVFTAKPARLDGYSRHCLRGRSYPGIQSNPQASVEGLLFFDIDEQDLRRLDEFEDSFYFRDLVTVTTADTIQWTAQAYIMREEALGMLLPEGWCLETFKLKHLSKFLEKHA